MDNFKEKKIDNVRIFYKKVGNDKNNSWYFLKQILSEKYNIYDFDIIKNKNGKPYLKNIPLYFNISHKKNVIGIAISNDEVGLDIEYIDKTKIVSDSFLKKVFNNYEIDYINNDIEKLFALWTKKESYIKYIGSRVCFIGDVDLNKIKTKQKTFKVDSYIFTISYGGKNYE